ncbi:Protein phosphatase 1D [Orchesella cincta]|uniref:Protein phosphatase 1D n=1 Tax=Orchesella cincta TaxID=48709 RepID=A0A1D2MPC3_ORCCI|nr:Protein phosphatase 1D [Orchesella cincta]
MDSDQDPVEQPVTLNGAGEDFGQRIYYTSCQDKGDLELMEDRHQIAFFDVEESPFDDQLGFSTAFFAIFDGHEGSEAATYVESRLLELITSNKHFNSDDDTQILKAIKKGYTKLQKDMKFHWMNNWPKSKCGNPSVSGTTASVVLIKNGKLYVVHVGDSAIVLGYQDPESPVWKAETLTKDHLADSPVELKRIEHCGGKVKMDKNNGIPKVIWKQPQLAPDRGDGGHGYLTRTSTVEPTPFLHLARCLGAFWSYNPEREEYIISSEPDTMVVTLDSSKHRCLVLGSKGLWNVLPAEKVVHLIYSLEWNNDRRRKNARKEGRKCYNLIHHSGRLVSRVKHKCGVSKQEADNISVIVVVF